jgi:hypothetical protein
MLFRPRSLLALVFLLGWALPGRAQPAVPPAPAPDSDGLPNQPPAGWFFSLTGMLTRTHASDSVVVLGGDYLGWMDDAPVARLGWTVVPLGTVGYRLEDGSALLASYRYIGGAGDNPALAARGHFDSHWLDLDYRGALLGLWCGPDSAVTFGWQTGLRVASITSASAWTLEEGRIATHDSFLGAGPHLGGDLSWQFAPSGLGLFGRADGGLLLGQNRRRFATADGVDRFSCFGTALSSRVEAGVSWTAVTSPWLRFEAGYALEAFLATSHGFQAPGPFIRFEVGF